MNKNACLKIKSLFDKTDEMIGGIAACTLLVVIVILAAYCLRRKQKRLTRKQRR